MIRKIYRNVSGESLDRDDRSYFDQRIERAEVMLNEKYPELSKWPIGWPALTVDWNLNAPIVARMDDRDELIVVSYHVTVYSCGFVFKYIDGISPEGKVTEHSFAGGVLSSAPDAVVDYIWNDFDDFINAVEGTLFSVRACMVGARKDTCDREPKADVTH
jgi:hypothetical protein